MLHNEHCVSSTQLKDLPCIVVLWLADTDVPSTVAAEAEAIVAVATESVIRAAVAMLMILILS